MYRPPKENQAPSAPQRLKLPLLNGMPSIKQVKEQCEHANLKRGTIIEQQWKTSTSGQSFNLMAQWDKGVDMPVWTLYEDGNGVESKMHWSQSSSPSDIDILYDVIAMTANEKGSAKIPESLKPGGGSGGLGGGGLGGGGLGGGAGGGGGLGGSFLGTRANNYSSLSPQAGGQDLPLPQAPAPIPSGNFPTLPTPNPGTSYTSLPQQAPYSGETSTFPDPNYPAAAPYPDPSQMYPPAQPAYPPPQPAYPPPQPAYPPPGGYPPPQPQYPPAAPPGYGYGGYPPPQPAYPPPAPPQPAYPPPAPAQPQYPPASTDSPWIAKTSESPAYNASSSSSTLPPELMPVKSGSGADYHAGSESGTNILLGALLFEAEFINQPTLDAALKLQDMVREGKLSAAKAPEALKRLHTMGSSIDQYINKGEIKGGSSSPSSGSSSAKSAGSSSSTNVAEQRAAFDLLQKAGLLKEEDLKSAQQVRSKHGGDMVMIMIAASKLDQVTYKAATTCVPLIRDNKMKVEQCIIALNYCSRSRVDFDTALEEMGWPNPLK